MQRGDCLLHMREGRVGQTAEVDHIGAGLRQFLRARDDIGHAHRRGVDDLREDAHIEAREIRRRAAASKIHGQIGDLLRPALEGNAELAAQHGEIGAAAARQNDAIRLDRTRQPAQDDFLRHQRRDLDADIANPPVPRRLAKARDHPREARIGEMPGDEQQARGHALHSLPASSRRRRSTASPSAARLSTTCVASNSFKRSVFSRSMRRG